MARQRRSEPGVLRGRRRPGLGRLALALSLLLIAGTGCDAGGSTGPLPPVENSGTSDAETPAGRLAGTWRATTLIEVPGDVQAWVTTWVFQPDGACLQTSEVRSVVDTVPRVTERRCSFTADGAVITIAYAGGPSVPLNYTVVSSEQLILDGLEYERLAS
jgi:hypothetical protein